MRSKLPSRPHRYASFHLLEPRGRVLRRRLLCQRVRAKRGRCRMRILGQQHMDRSWAMELQFNLPNERFRQLPDEEQVHT